MNPCRCGPRQTKPGFACKRGANARCAAPSTRGACRARSIEPASDLHIEVAAVTARRSDLAAAGGRKPRGGSAGSRRAPRAMQAERLCHARFCRSLRHQRGNAHGPAARRGGAAGTPTDLALFARPPADAMRALGARLSSRAARSAARFADLGRRGGRSARVHLAEAVVPIARSSTRCAARREHEDAFYSRRKRHPLRPDGSQTLVKMRWARCRVGKMFSRRLTEIDAPPKSTSQSRSPRRPRGVRKSGESRIFGSRKRGNRGKVRKSIHVPAPANTPSPAIEIDRKIEERSDTLRDRLATFSAECRPAAR